MTSFLKSSKFLSLVLRHNPSIADIVLDNEGYAKVEDLLKNTKWSFEYLNQVVITNDKQRFEFNEDKTLIRARQGHSLKDVDLKYDAIKPPEILFHGTSLKNLKPILSSGLKKMDRNYVHLSESKETAFKVGSRYSRDVVIFTVKSLDMFHNGFCFFRSNNNVWLTDFVPEKYLTIEENN